jgi:DNA invertase Pin-like site-specific DNA recombinase
MTAVQEKATDQGRRIITHAPDGRRIRIFRYTRLSKDQWGERVEHVTQHRTLDELGDRMGWPEPDPEDCFFDNDASASKDEIIRDAFEAMLVRFHTNVNPATELAIMTAYSQDRLQRLPGDPKRIADIVENRDGWLWTAVGGQINVKTGGRDGFYFAGTVNVLEAEKISARTKAGTETAAMEGRPHGQKSYGWDRVYDEMYKGRPRGSNKLNEEEAKVIRDAAEWVLSGKSLTSYARKLNAEGIAAPGDGKVVKLDKLTKQPVQIARSGWNTQKLSKILQRESNVGIRVRKDRKTGKVTRHKAAWDPILDEDTYTKLMSKLHERKTGQDNRIKHLLSHAARCGACGAPMIHALVHPDKRSPGAKIRVVYRCDENRCVSREAKFTESIVDATFVAMFTNPEIRKLLDVNSDVNNAAKYEQIRALEARIEIVDEMMINDPDMSPESYRRMVSGLRDKIKAIKSTLKVANDKRVYQPLLDCPLEEVGDLWDEIRRTDVVRARSLLKAVVDIRIDKTRMRGRGQMDPASVVVTLKKEFAAA